MNGQTQAEGVERRQERSAGRRALGERERGDRRPASGRCRASSRGRTGSPSTGAAASPTAGTACTRTSRCSHGTSPAKTRPEHDRQHAEHDRSSRCHVTSHSPTAPERAPSSTKTVEKPSTKSSEPRNIRPRRCGRLFARSAPREPGGVGEVARQQRDHARARRTTPARRPKRPGSPAPASPTAAVLREPVSHRRTSARRDVVDDVAADEGRRRTAARPVMLAADPALVVEHHGGRDGLG